MNSKSVLQRVLLFSLPMVAAVSVMSGCGSFNQTPQTSTANAKIVDAAQSGDGWRHSDVIDPIKDPAGIAFYYRVERGTGDDPLTVYVRFDHVSGDDARVQLRLTDGATFASDAQHTRWQLPKNAASELSVAIRAPKGYSYLVLDLQQNGKSSTRPISLRNGSQ